MNPFTIGQEVVYHGRSHHPTPEWVGLIGIIVNAHPAFDHRCLEIELPSGRKITPYYWNVELVNTIPTPFQASLRAYIRAELGT